RRFRFAPRRRLETTFGRRAVFEDAVTRLFREVETRAVLLELLDYPHALLVVAKALGQETSEQLLADVAEGRVPDVVTERHRLDEVLVEPQGASQCAPDLIHLEDVRQASAVMIADGREEDLPLVLRAPERFAVDDAVAVDRECGPCRRRLVGFVAPAVGALGRIRRESRALELLGALAYAQRRDAAVARELRGAFNFGGHVAAKTSGDYPRFRKTANENARRISICAPAGRCAQAAASVRQRGGLICQFSFCRSNHRRSASRP